MSFEEYLASKMIDSDTYKASEPAQWSSFAAIFEQMHPKSFTLQKLNLINGIRREFPFVVEKSEQEQLKQQVARPVMKSTVQPVVKTSGDASKKPVMKPKIATGKPKIGKPVMKAKMTRPVMKPKMTPDQKDENKEVAKPKPSMKPKMTRPVMKPKNKDK